MAFCRHTQTVIPVIILLCILTTPGPVTAQHTPNLKALSVDDILTIKPKEDWLLIDTRLPDEYNGWRADQMTRGGHIPDSIDFCSSWLDLEIKDKSIKLKAVRQTKGIQPQKHIVLCSTIPLTNQKVASYLHRSGFRRLYSFDMRPWVADDHKPLVRYPGFHLLVPPFVVRQILNGHRPETFEQTVRFKLVEVSWGGEGASYSKGHIPGSFHVNTDHFEPPPSWKLGNPDLLRHFAETYGFQADDTVILSGEDPTASYRLAVVLQYMGVRDVRVLNGGLSTWKAAGYPLETQSHAPPQVNSFGAIIPVHPELVDTTSEVKQAFLASEPFVLVDTRTWAEYTGNTSGYTYHFRKGRIPGSTYGQADFTGKNSLTPYRNLDNTMRNNREIITLWEKAGIDTRHHLSFMCGGGWRAAEVLTFAQVMGIRNTSLYSDGWIGWSRDRSNPTESGTPPQTPSSKPQIP